MVSTTNLVCECGDPECGLSVRVTVDTLKNITDIAGAIVIVDDCTRGPQVEDKLSSSEDGYTVYIRPD